MNGWVGTRVGRGVGLAVGGGEVGRIGDGVIVGTTGRAGRLGGCVALAEGVMPGADVALSLGTGDKSAGFQISGMDVAIGGRRLSVVPYQAQVGQGGLGGQRCRHELRVGAERDEFSGDPALEVVGAAVALDADEYRHHCDRWQD